jgi:hypothetical protein
MKRLLTIAADAAAIAFLPSMATCMVAAVACMPFWPRATDVLMCLAVGHIVIGLMVAALAAAE